MRHAEYRGARSAVSGPSRSGPFSGHGGAGLLGMCRLVSESLCFSREAIRRVDGSAGVLYQECLARLYVDGQRWLPASFLGQLEGAGLMRWFDGLVFARTLGALRGDAQVSLGCNLTAASAVDDGAWEPAFRLLGKYPDVAQRLVIEITESAPLQPEVGGRFIRRLRHLGCRVAVDDFGVGYGAATSIAIGDPDIVKIDASLLAMARQGKAGMLRLRGVVELALEMTPVVVVEGVEQDADLDLIALTQARWAQGYLFEPTYMDVPEGN